MRTLKKSSGGLVSVLLSLAIVLSLAPFAGLPAWASPANASARGALAAAVPIVPLAAAVPIVPLAAAVPIVPLAAGGVTLGQPGVTDTVSRIQAAIQAAINAPPLGGGTVVVDGYFAIAPSTLTLYIPDGVTVKWQAMYLGAPSDSLIKTTGGGTLQVESGGWLLNTGSGTGINAVDTKIVVTGTGPSLGGYGIVDSTSGSAIVAAGLSTVTVEGYGGVLNEATSNIQPVINMTNAAYVGDNVFVTGEGVVWATANNNSSNDRGYAIQTYGNVVVSGGTVQSSSYNGRAINLVGPDSEARISGGNVVATGVNGVAISSATTNASTVPRASVYVSGGAVVALSGHAIRTTGANSKIEVTGGTVSTTTGNAIRTEGGAGASITVSGGFVFAYGSSINGNANVIHMVNAGATTPSVNSPAGNAVVVAWNYGITSAYVEGYATHLTVNPVGSAVWHNSDSGDGIAYENGANLGFFPLPVFVDSDFGLIFDVATEKFYLDVNGDGVIAGDPEYTTAPLGSWSYASGIPTGTLTLNGFNWNTTAATALKIIGGNLTIDLNGSNGLTSTYNGVDKNTYGVFVDSGINLTLEGSGSLEASGGATAAPCSGGISLDLDGKGALIVNGATLIATGGSCASISSGIDAYTIELYEGIVNAAGGESGSYSYGIFSSNITIAGGMMRAAGGPGGGLGEAFSAGVAAHPSSYGATTFVMSAGTFEALGNSEAFDGNFTAPVFPLCYIYWTNTIPEDSDDAGKLYGDGTLPYGTAFVNATEYKYVKIVASSFAAVADVTITGEVDEVLAVLPLSTTIYLYGATLKFALTSENVNDWFAAGILPDGVNVTANGLAGADVIVIEFSGTPETTSAAAFRINVPGDAISGAISEGAISDGEDITVEFNPDANFLIVYSPITPDDTSPEVIEVKPAGADAPVDGTIEITFDEAIDPDPAKAGTVLLNGVPLSLLEAYWFGNTLVAPYAGLDYDMTYEVTIAAFVDLAGNMMEPDATHSFKTAPEPSEPPLPPAVTYDVTVISSLASSNGEGSYEAGSLVTITAENGEEFIFTGWTANSAAVVFDDSGSPITTFIMPEHDVVVTAGWRPDIPPPVYTDASIDPSTATFDKNTAGLDNKNVVVTLSPGSYMFAALMLGSYTLQVGTDYTVSGDVFTINKEYLATLGLGTESIIFEMDGGADPILSVTIVDTTSPDPPDPDDPDPDDSDDPDDPDDPGGTNGAGGSDEPGGTPQTGDIRGIVGAAVVSLSAFLAALLVALGYRKQRRQRL